MATGDDSGAVKVWDVRQGQNVMGFDCFQDYVSGFAYCDSHDNTLVATSGDGSLAAFDFRTKRLLGRTEELEEDILSIEYIRNGTKLVAGTSEGVLLLYNFGNWDGPIDSFPGHPQSIDCILKMEEGTILTGSCDGMIRVIGLNPKKLYGLVGDHEGFPIEKMRWSWDHNLIGTVSHDTTVRFWDVSYLHDDDDDEEEGEEQADPTEEDVVAAAHVPSSTGPAMDSDDDDSDDWEDDSDDSDAEAAAPPPQPRRQPKFQTSAQRFFSDL